MIKLTDILTEWSKEFIAEQRKVMKEKKVNASGSLSQSIKYTVDVTGTKITAGKVATWIDRGRATGGRPPIQAIAKWIRIKGYDLNPYAVANKMAKEGSVWYRKSLQGEQRGVFDNEELQRRMVKKLIEMLTKEFAINLKSELTQIWK